MNRPELNEISLQDAISSMYQPGASITMGIDQWDNLLREAYEHGWTLLELDDDEILIKAYRKPRC